MRSLGGRWPSSLPNERRPVRPLFENRKCCPRVASTRATGLNDDVAPAVDAIIGRRPTDHLKRILLEPTPGLQPGNSFITREIKQPALESTRVPQSPRSPAYGPLFTTRRCGSMGLDWKAHRHRPQIAPRDASRTTLPGSGTFGVRAVSIQVRDVNAVTRAVRSSDATLVSVLAYAGLRPGRRSPFDGGTSVGRPSASTRRCRSGMRRARRTDDGAPSGCLSPLPRI
jgi:hypothetical protein